MAGPAPGARQAATAAQPYRPPRSPGYLPPTQPSRRAHRPPRRSPRPLCPQPTPPTCVRCTCPSSPRAAAPAVGARPGHAGRFTGAIDLAAGWNLLSLPEEPPSTSVDNIFTAIGGQYSRVFAYDGCDAADPWREYDPANAGESDLTTVDFRHGLWLQPLRPWNCPWTVRLISAPRRSSSAPVGTSSATRWPRRSWWAPRSPVSPASTAAWSPTT